MTAVKKAIAVSSIATHELGADTSYRVRYLFLQNRDSLGTIQAGNRIQMRYTAQRFTGMDIHYMAPLEKSLEQTMDQYMQW